MTIKLLLAVNANNLRETERLLVVEHAYVNYTPTPSETMQYNISSSAIKIAIEKGNLAMARLLKKCCPNEFDVDAGLIETDRALYYLISSNSENLRFETVAFLLASGADFEILAQYDWFPNALPQSIQSLFLFEALLRGKLTTVENLLERKVHLDVHLLHEYLTIEPRQLTSFEKEGMQKCLAQLKQICHLSPFTINVIDTILNKIPVYEAIKASVNPEPTNLGQKVEDLSKRVELMMREIKSLKEKLAAHETDRTKANDQSARIVYKPGMY